MKETMKKFMGKLTKKRVLKLCVVAIIFGITIILMNVYYQNKLAKTIEAYEFEKMDMALDNAGVKRDYTELSNDYENLKDDYAELAEQVYLMMDGKEYEFEFEYDDAIHMYTGVKKGFWIKDKHAVIKVDSSLK